MFWDLRAAMIVALLVTSVLAYVEKFYLASSASFLATAFALIYGFTYLQVNWDAHWYISLGFAGILGSYGFFLKGQYHTRKNQPRNIEKS